MPVYECDLCDKRYKQKMNLKQHVCEKHRNIEFWNCPETLYVTQFISPEYQSRHLCAQHGFSMMKAHEAACLAPRGYEQNKIIMKLKVKMTQCLI